MTADWLDELEPEKRAKLESGWDWLKSAPDGQKKNAFFDRWLALKDVYEEKYAPKRPAITLPEPSPWIEELRTQLTLGGIADVEQKPKGRVQD